MKFRCYRLGQRQATSDQTRARVVAATRDLLAAPDGAAAFTIDAVAAKAGVARMTVYNQFGSKRGLLGALFDHLAAAGLVDRLRAAYALPDPCDALTDLVGAFAAFWASDRTVLRRIRGLASIDPDFEQAVRERDERRREGLRVLVDRLSASTGKPAPGGRDDVVNVLHTLTSFETFDNLAGPDRTPDAVVPIVGRLVRTAAGLAN